MGSDFEAAESCIRRKSGVYSQDTCGALWKKDYIQKRPQRRYQAHKLSFSIGSISFMKATHMANYLDKYRLIFDHLEDTIQYHTHCRPTVSGTARIMGFSSSRWRRILVAQYGSRIVFIKGRRGGIEISGLQNPPICGRGRLGGRPYTRRYTFAQVVNMPPTGLRLWENPLENNQPAIRWNVNEKQL